MGYDRLDSSNNPKKSNYGVGKFEDSISIDVDGSNEEEGGVEIITINNGKMDVVRRMLMRLRL